MTDDERAELERYRTWAPVAERLLKDERDARKQAEAERDMERRRADQWEKVAKDQRAAMERIRAAQVMPPREV